MKNLFLILLVIITLNLSATIINIPADQPTIQAGINIAIDGDTVLVQIGTYVENINYNGMNITVASHFLTTQDTSYISQTIIDGNQSGSVITFANAEDSTAVITGFTIQNGFNWDGGGGILCDSSDPVIINNIIKDNLGDSGGGIKCISSNAKFFYNIIHNNSYVSVLGNPGGGICCINGSNCIIMFNIIHHNQNQDGSGIASFDSDPIISNNIIYENEATDLGGGMRCKNSNAIITNNTFFGNTSSEAGGIYVDYGCNLTIVNNILWNNLPNEITGDIIITYSDIEGGYTGIGNIDSDPLFVDSQNSNFQLDQNSPCIDAGDPAFPLDPDGTIIEMGALYFNQETSVTDYELQITNYELNNYPNPFNHSTTISFLLSEESNIDLSVYNVKGQKVKSIVKKSFESGNHSAIWNGDNESGEAVSSGVYLYKLNVNSKTKVVKKCLLLK